jgi:hypothetical protein
MSRSKQTTRSDLRRAECRDRAAEIGAFVDGLSDTELASRFRQWIEGRLNAAETMVEPFGIVRISEKFLAEVAEVLRPFWPDLAERAIACEPQADRVVYPLFGRGRPGEGRDVPTKDAEVIALGSHMPDTPDP